MTTVVIYDYVSHLWLYVIYDFGSHIWLRVVIYVYSSHSWMHSQSTQLCTPGILPPNTKSPSCQNLPLESTRWKRGVRIFLCVLWCILYGYVLFFLDENFLCKLWLHLFNYWEIVPYTLKSLHNLQYDIVWNCRLYINGKCLMENYGKLGKIEENNLFCYPLSI